MKFSSLVGGCLTLLVGLSLIPFSQRKLLALTPPREPSTLSLVVVTGSRVASTHHRQATSRCRELNQRVAEWWTDLDPAHVVAHETKVGAVLEDMRQETDVCVLQGNDDLYFTFPLALKAMGDPVSQHLATTAHAADGQLDVSLDTELLRRCNSSSATFKVPFFLAHPRIAQLANVAKPVVADFRVMVVDNRGQVAGSALERYACSITRSVRRPVGLQPSFVIQRAHNVLLAAMHAEIATSIHDNVHVCRVLEASATSIEALDKQCVDQAPTASPLPSPSKIDQNVDPKPTLVFIAGLEGTGHHLLQHVLPLEHFSMSLWRSFKAIGAAKSRKEYDARVAEWEEMLHKKFFSEPYNVIFLNSGSLPDGTKHLKKINLLSFPYGGVECPFQHLARFLCEPSITLMAAATRKLGIRFKVIELRRSRIQAIESSSLRRRFNSIGVQTHIVRVADAFMQQELAQLPEGDVFPVSFERLRAKNRTDHEEVYKTLFQDWLGLELESRFKDSFLSRLEST